MGSQQAIQRPASMYLSRYFRRTPLVLLHSSIRNSITQLLTRGYSNGIVILVVLLLDLLPIHKNERANNDHRTDPINDALRPALHDQLPHQRERDRQAQPHGHDERTRQDHGVGPADIAEQAGEAVDEEDGPDASRGWQLEGFDLEDGEDREEGEEEDGIDEADEAEEEGHVEGFALSSGGVGRSFQRDSVDAVDNGGESGHGVAKGEFGGRFVWEGLTEAAVALGIFRVVGRWGWIRGDVDLGYQEDSDEACKHAEEFAPGKFLGAGESAY